MSCEWIFEGQVECPKCNWPSYGARFVYGNKAYRYKLTQKPWKDKRMFEYSQKLEGEIKQSLNKLSCVFMTHKQFGAK